MTFHSERKSMLQCSPERFWGEVRLSIRSQNGRADRGIFRRGFAPLQTTMRFQKFVIAFTSGNCYESACCGWLSIGKRRAMPSLLRNEKIGGHH
ncbi:MAG: hypothetical protein DMF08_09320 [Verrucomicrobia bacterium]|nr:MAG: hypothetical protein DMF08_09320 [Verrucomicrobiota bacterium]